MRRRAWAFGAAAALLWGLATGAGAAPAQPGTPAAGSACDVARMRPPPGVTLVSAQRTAVVPPGKLFVYYCRVSGYVTTTEPGPNRVNFMLALPDQWNGRFLFPVQGGSAGFLLDPSAAHVEEGYAVASTDKGTVTAGLWDFSFRDDPAMELDWAHRGMHVSAVATQALTRAYYGRDRLYRYVMGCSGGGDGSMTEAEMYPGDFDGYIPAAMNTDWPSGSSYNWVSVAQRVSQVKGAWISAETYERIHEVLLRRYDGADGAVDGLIWNGRVIELDGEDRKALGFLSDAQFGTLKLIASDMKDASGRVMSPGFWLSNVKMSPFYLTSYEAPPWSGPADWPNGFTVAETSAKAQLGQAFSWLKEPNVNGRDADVNQTKFDHRRLAGLQQAGAKMILWVGAAEEAVTPEQILGYTDRADATFGREQRESFLRTFVVPGLHHCRNGDGIPTDYVDRMLKAMERWVELGEAPQSVTVSNPQRTFLLCPYPRRSVFSGGLANPQKLDVNDAKNWRCEAPGPGRAAGAD